MFDHPRVCADCGGICCKRGAGCAMPDDFSDRAGRFRPEMLRAALATDMWAMDWWEGDPRARRRGDTSSSVEFIRPRYVGEPVVNGSWGGRCVFLGIDGCDLAPGKRPTGCRMLEPKPGRLCVEHGGGKRQSAVAWMKHGALLKELVEEFA